MQGAFVHHGLDFRTSRRDEPSAETIRALVCDVLGELRTDDGDGANGEKRKNDTHSSTGLVISTLPSQSSLCGRQSCPTRASHHGEPGWADMLTLANGTAERCSLERTLKIKTPR